MIMWKRYTRFEEFQRELAELERGRKFDYENESFILKGIINCFEMLFDLSWKVMKDIIHDYCGALDYSLGYPAENIREAFKVGLINDDGIWIKILKVRNLLTNDYDYDIARQEVNNIINIYFFTFKNFEKMLKILWKIIEKL